MLISVETLYTYNKNPSKSYMTIKPPTFMHLYYWILARLKLMIDCVICKTSPHVNKVNVCIDGKEPIKLSKFGNTVENKVHVCTHDYLK